MLINGQNIPFGSSLLDWRFYLRVYLSEHIYLTNISEYVKHIFLSGGLDEVPTVRKIRTVQKGKKPVDRTLPAHYKRGVIKLVGHRVNSKHRFPQWAIQQLFCPASLLTDKTFE